MLSVRKAFSRVPHRAGSEAEIYEPLTHALRRKTKHKSRCPGFIFEQTFQRSIRPLRLGYAKPHICCFAVENRGAIQRSRKGSRVEFGYAELFIHVAADPTDDFFVDPDPAAPANTLASHDFTRQFLVDDTMDQAQYRKVSAQYKHVNRTYGHHLACVVEVFARQQRIFLFTISFSGSMARLHRWDRSGCVVSQAFDVRERPDILAEFLWRFSRLSAAGRGHDNTVRPASPAEESLFRTVVRDYVASQLDIAGVELDKAVSAHYQPEHVTSIRVSSQSPGSVGQETYIVSRPVVSPLSLDGRSTRGYWAVNASSKQIGFLKDTWRTCSAKEVEGDVLKRLNELGVRNVPTLATHGDVLENGETGVGYSLRTLRGTEELLHSTHDAFIAMRDALAKDSRIHRDLSVGNIVLVKEKGRTIRKGYLIDWDASDRVDDKGESLQPGRTGTWAFTSIRMLRPSFAQGKHTFKDDMEALVYVVLYCALFYLPHDLTAEDLTGLHRAFFEKRVMIKDVPTGGDAKISNARSRDITGRVHFGSAGFREWLETVLDYHTPFRSQVPVGMGEKWEPETLDAYWTRFLETHTLERDDRTVHQLDMFDHWDDDSPYSEPVPSPESQRSERDPPGSDTAAVGHLRRKRSRSPNGQPAASSSRSKRAREGHFARPCEPPTRRSQRIREQQSRMEVAAAAAVTINKPSVKTMAANGARSTIGSSVRQRK
ncbi:hypothetical protein BN946_scf184847.g6 [Trametes cinnabarina]|uniref:Fungal-type protein kinase domain-containing protein n=1 Tax=Pycnoporus cinnabarinus TaxID=5643 RepID=A0A060SQH6_PYCCI|nr:hypothetical protein BN946_scf184847.g6 [Trametes cinnabarina]